MKNGKRATARGGDIILEDPSVLRLGISEKEFAQAVVELAEALGWMVWRTWVSLHSPKGEPDLRMVNVDQRRVVWAEVKSDKGKLTAAQAEAILTLRSSGAEVYVWRPGDWEKIQAVLKGERPDK